MHDLIHFHAQATPAKKAIVDLHTGEAYDYRHTDQRISQIASYLLKATDGERGGRVADDVRREARADGHRRGGHDVPIERPFVGPDAATRAGRGEGLWLAGYSRSRAKHARFCRSPIATTIFGERPRETPRGI